MPAPDGALMGYRIHGSLSEKEQRLLARAPEVRHRGIDVARCCREGDVLCLSDARGRLMGFTARTHFRNFCYVHSAVFRGGVGDLLYRETLRLAVRHTFAVFLTLDANHPSCMAGRRCGAFTTSLLELDHSAPDFVERIRDFPPGGYYRDGNQLRSVIDTPEDRTLIFKVTAASFANATGERVFATPQLAVA